MKDGGGSYSPLFIQNPLALRFLHSWHACVHCTGYACCVVCNAHIMYRDHTSGVSEYKGIVRGLLWKTQAHHLVFSSQHALYIFSSSKWFMLSIASFWILGYRQRSWSNSNPGDPQDTCRISLSFRFGPEWTKAMRSSHRHCRQSMSLEPVPHELSPGSPVNPWEKHLHPRLDAKFDQGRDQVRWNTHTLDQIQEYLTESVGNNQMNKMNKIQTHLPKQSLHWLISWYWSFLRFSLFACSSNLLRHICRGIIRHSHEKRCAICLSKLPWKRKCLTQFEDKIISLQDSRCNVSHKVHKLIKPASFEKADLKHTVKRMKKSRLDMKASIALVLK